MKLPLSRSAYKRGDERERQLRNGFFEVDPRNQEDQVSLYRRGGLEAFANVGSGPIRGIWRQDGSVRGLIIVVSGPGVYSVATAGVVTTISGTIAGTGPVRMAGSRTTVLISNDQALYTTDGATLTEETLPDDFTPGDVAYIASRFLVTEKD